MAAAPTSVREQTVGNGTATDVANRTSTSAADTSPILTANVGAPLPPSGVEGEKEKRCPKPAGFPDALPAYSGNVEGWLLPSFLPEKKTRKNGKMMLFRGLRISANNFATVGGMPANHRNPMPVVFLEEGGMVKTLGKYLNQYYRNKK
jgi:hypothetical protein